MREVPSRIAEAECTKGGRLEVSCASGEEGPDDEGRNQGKELGERVWQSWSWSRGRKGEFVVAGVAGRVEKFSG